MQNEKKIFTYHVIFPCFEVPSSFVTYKFEMTISINDDWCFTYWITEVLRSVKLEEVWNLRSNEYVFPKVHGKNEYCYVHDDLHARVPSKPNKVTAKYRKCIDNSTLWPWSPWCIPVSSLLLLLSLFVCEGCNWGKLWCVASMWTNLVKAGLLWWILWWTLR